MRTLDRDEDLRRAVAARLASDVVGNLLSDSSVDAEDETKLLRVGGSVGRDVGDGEGVRLAVEVGTTEKVESPWRADGERQR